MKDTDEVQPEHVHDCDGCTFLGRYNGHDLYFCPQGGRPTVIARYGPEGDYLSGLCFDIPALNEAKRLARERGLLPT